MPSRGSRRRPRLPPLRRPLAAAGRARASARAAGRRDARPLSPRRARAPAYRELARPGQLARSERLAREVLSLPALSRADRRRGARPSWTPSARPAMAEGRRDAQVVGKALTPPIVVIAVKGAAPAARPSRGRAAPAGRAGPRGPGRAAEFEHVPEGWERPTPRDGTAARSPTPTSRSGPSGSPRSTARRRSASTTRRARASRSARDDLAAHNMLVSFAYVVARAAHGRTRSRSSTGAAGSGTTRVLARAVLPDVELDWHCREVPVRRARRARR